MDEWRTAAVHQLQDEGVLFVEDGNHGQDRPRPNEFVDHGVAFIRAGDMKDRRIDFVGASKINDVAYKRIRKGFGRPLDVLFSHKGTVGRVAIAPADAPPFVCSPQTTYWRSLDRKRLDPRYLRYFLESPGFVRQVAARSGETDMAAYVSLTEQRKLIVTLPPLHEQRTIAEVLGALDDKIESNRRLRDTADELVSAIFSATLSCGGTPWTSSWPVSQLGDHLAVLETGSRPPGGVGGIVQGVPSIGAESITRPGEFDFGKVKLVPRAFFDGMRRGVLEDRDVLLYKDGGTPGNFEPHVSMVGQGFPFAEAAINEHVYRLRISPPFTQDYLYAWLSAPATMEEMRRRGTGVAIPSLNSSNLRSLPFAVPDEALLAAAQVEAEPVMTSLLHAASESRTLGELRDALLPELLTGRLRAPIVEELVGAST